MSDQARWPYNGSQAWLSLRAGGRSTLISDARYVTEHRCGFWVPLHSS